MKGRNNRLLQEPQNQYYYTTGQESGYRGNYGVLKFIFARNCVLGLKTGSRISTLHSMAENLTECPPVGFRGANAEDGWIVLSFADRETASETAS